MSGVERLDAHTLYFTTLKGVLGHKDTREPSSSATIYRLTDKKIGGFTLNPRAPHLAATASLDRTVKIWDLRKIVGRGDDKTPHCVAEHTSKLSVSAAIWNTTGSVVTTSYDDTIKVYKMPDSRNWKEGYTIDEFEPDVVIPHNNQTGRWVTMYVLISFLFCGFSSPLQCFSHLHSILPQTTSGLFQLDFAYYR